VPQGNTFQIVRRQNVEVTRREGFDPLEVIEGVGPGNQEKLWKAGIKTFKDLAESTMDRLEAIIGVSGLEYGLWIVEARRFVRGDYQLRERNTTRGTKKDDLTVIEGIGPKINAALVAAGLDTFEELEAASEAQLKGILQAAGLSFAPSIGTWPRQAGFLARGDKKGFKAYTEHLVAGREPGKA
jgi:predicted flap endonuclease-1-like 5' DNA nuclease